jgi:hypothetical protein
MGIASHRSLAVALMAHALVARINDPVLQAAARMSHNPAAERMRGEPGRVHGSRRTTVAAMKRAAKKRRNVRRNSSKRRSAA